MSDHDPDCIFCKIAQGQIAAKKVFEDEDLIAFHDIHPKAPVHILMVPKRHLVSLMHAGPSDQALLGKMLVLAPKIAQDNGSPGGFKLLVNSGKVGGQEVYHLHMHLLGGPDRVGARGL